MTFSLSLLALVTIAFVIKFRKNKVMTLITILSMMVLLTTAALTMPSAT